MLIWLSLPSLTYYPLWSSTRHCVSEWFIPQALSSILSVCVTLKYQPTCWMADPCLKDQFPISLQKSLESPTAYGLGLGSVGTARMSRARLFYTEESKLMAILWVSRICLRPMQKQHEEFRITDTPENMHLLPARPAETANWVLIETVAVAAVSGIFSEIEFREWCFTAAGRESGCYCSSRC